MKNCFNNAMKGAGRGRSRRRGAVILETAIVFLFVVLPLTMAIFQFGLFYAASNALTHLTRDGARFAAVYCVVQTDNKTTPGDESSDQFIIDHILQQAKSSILSDLDASSISITPDRGSRTQYALVKVTISYDMNKKAFFPIGGRIFKPGLQTRTAEVMVE